MKDLLLYVADADTEAFMRSILGRPQALGIREVTFDVSRHPQRDAGMVQSGAELTRMKKGYYSKALLIWDHHGSGRDHKLTAAESASAIQDKLDAFSWKDNSATVVLVPELEQWLWYCPSAVAAHCGLNDLQLSAWVEERARGLGRTVAKLQKDQPKELFEHIMRDKLRRTISPLDFAEMGRRSSVKALRDCESFRAIADTLQRWFPH